jgi:hypothetical protein
MYTLLRLYPFYFPAILRLEISEPLHLSFLLASLLVCSLAAATAGAVRGDPDRERRALRAAALRHLFVAAARLSINGVSERAHA